jgi:hypothetical protein
MHHTISHLEAIKLDEPQFWKCWQTFRILNYSKKTNLFTHIPISRRYDRSELNCVSIVVYLDKNACYFVNMSLHIFTHAKIKVFSNGHVCTMDLDFVAAHLQNPK